MRIKVRTWVYICIYIMYRRECVGCDSTCIVVLCGRPREEDVYNAPHCVPSEI